MSEPKMTDGDKLGLKPDEFEVVEWHVSPTPHEQSREVK